MGLILRDEPGPTQSKVAERHAAGLQSLGSLKLDDLPEREISGLSDSRQAGFQVVVARSVLENISEHGRGEPDIEVCGVLVGNVCRDAAGPYLHIQANIRGNNAPGRAAQVTFTADTWKHIQDVMERDFPEEKIVGWYHTHPGFGIFLSDMDLFIQNNFFAEPWQVAYVYDPKSDEQGLFLHRDGQTIREKFLIDEEGEPAQAATAPVSTSAPAATQMVAPGTIAELSDRVQKLERRQRWMAAGLWLLLMAGILWPLVIFVFLPSGRLGLSPELQKVLGRDERKSEVGTALPTTAAHETRP